MTSYHRTAFPLDEMPSYHSWAILTHWGREKMADILQETFSNPFFNDGVIKWKHFPCYWPFMRAIHQSPVNSPHKRQWRGALMFSLICTRTNGWVNSRNDLRRHRAHCYVTVMSKIKKKIIHNIKCFVEKLPLIPLLQGHIENMLFRNTVITIYTVGYHYGIKYLITVLIIP